MNEREMFRAVYDIDSDGIALYGFIRDFDDGSIGSAKYRAVGIRWEPIKPHQLIQKKDGPLVTLDDRDARQLMDDLWSCGIRPTQSRHISETLKAKDQHIESLERIVQMAMQWGDNEIRHEGV